MEIGCRNIMGNVDLFEVCAELLLFDVIFIFLLSLSDYSRFVVSKTPEKSITRRISPQGFIYKRIRIRPILDQDFQFALIILYLEKSTPAYTYHVPGWDKNTRDNAYLTCVHHVVCCVDQETTIQETFLSHNISSHLDAWHLYYVAHDNPCLYTFVYLNFFVFTMIWNNMLAWYIR